MEREILFTGIGGQGVQLAANVLAHAALSEGRDVQLFGSYGGMMRGGNTDATLVVADEQIESPPTVGAAWAAVLMHPDYAEPVLNRVRPGGLVLRNTGVWDSPLARADVEVVDLDAAALAVGAGHVMAAAMVMLGALCAITGLVGVHALEAGVRACVPPYRHQHLELDDRALAAGAAAVAATAAPRHRAWEPEGAGTGSRRP
jgi:Pyruvate/2-oxoacid:ferredoxin oxidoreductase gamma subunit